MAEIGLDRPGVATVIGKLVPAGVPQHVGMSLDAQIRDSNCPLHQAGKSWRRQRCSTLRHEDEGDDGLSR